MKIFTDWFLRQGTKHKMCQDYVITGKDYIILADGCSSSKYLDEDGEKQPALTDIGARLLCNSAQWFIELQRGHVPDYNAFGHQVISYANLVREMMHLPIGVLDATLMVAIVYEDLINVYTYGDGYLIHNIKFCDNNYSTIYKYEYSGNAPHYLSYWLDSERKDRYIAKYGGKYTLRLRDYNNSSKWSDETKIDEGLSSFPIEDEATLILMSDGAGSFIKRNGILKPYSDFDAINQLTQIKPGGSFIKRGSNLALKYFNKNGIDHTDDLSIVGMHIRREE